MRARWIFSAAVLASAAGLFATSAAHALPPVNELILVSSDGENFSVNPAFTLFDDIGRVVPGDQATEDVWVKSASSEDGRLRLDMFDVSANNIDLADNVLLAVTIGDRETAEVSITDGINAGTCLMLDDQKIMAPGETVKITARLRVNPLLGEQSGRDGVLSDVEFRVRATLSDASVPAAAAPKCAPVPEGLPTPVPTPTPTPTPTDGALPATGAAPAPVGLIVGGSLAVGAGIALAIWRRRRADADRDSENHTP